VTAGASFQLAIVPSVYLTAVTEAAANECLQSWGHKMGPLNRPFPSRAHGLVAGGRLVAVATTGPLIRGHVAGLPHLNRENTVELSRLCAERPGLCRVMIRLWREFVFPELQGVSAAVSYQDADLHKGHTYRFDGWRRAGMSRSGTDARSGRRGRRKWVWVWPPEAIRAV